MASSRFTGNDESFLTRWYSSSEEDSVRSDVKNSISAEKDEDSSNNNDSRMIKRALVEYNLDFDLEDFSKSIPKWTLKLKEDLMPGTYSHYVLLLLDTQENIMDIQRNMQQFLADQYPDKFNEVNQMHESGIYASTDMELVASEFQTLRSLLKPLRENITMSSAPDVARKGRKEGDVFETVRELNKARAILDQFIADVLVEIPREEDRLSLNSPGGEERVMMLNARLARIDGCVNSIDQNSLPSSSSSKGKEGLNHQVEISQILQEIEELPFYQSQPNSQEFMFTIAAWLARTESATAVDLFCDVAKIFFSRMPKSILTDDEFWQRHFLSSIYPEDGGLPAGSNPWMGYDPSMSNSTYFKDVARSQKFLMASIRKGPVPLKIYNGLVPPPIRHGFQLTSHGGPLDGKHGKTTDPKASAPKILH